VRFTQLVAGLMETGLEAPDEAAPAADASSEEDAEAAAATGDCWQALRFSF
jgi:hypothetical protein